ncbi:MAG: peptidoglycan-binding protein LysM [Paenibacillaceae bacterium]|nr:peptidoglycan-binding protein LysM [Paenibacillaceae bacterium]
MWMEWREESKVTDERSGLRFDIYERVHLAEDAVSIRDLDEIELVPQIRVDNDSEQAVLTGNLLLSGIYQGEDEHSSHRLEHRIPVEITLPISRIHRIEEISVEIENFDVDLISARSMNITGVLSLRGIELAGAEEEKSWKEEEEIVFVHRADEGAATEGAANGAAIESEPEVVPAWAPFLEPSVRSEAIEAPVDVGDPPSAEAAEAVADDQAQQEESAVDRSESVLSAATAAESADQAEAEGETAEVAIAGESEPESASPQEFEVSSESVTITDDSAAVQKQDVKIAFSGKKSDGAEESNKFKSALHKLLNRDSQDGGAGAQRAAAEEQSVEQTRSPDSLEWKRLFLGGGSSDGDFRRVRMCIVQKEESIDTIAERYQLNPREIILYNRLGDGQINEGQVIYIPK